MEKRTAQPLALVALRAQRRHAHDDVRHRADGASVVNNTSVISLSAVAKPVIAKAYR